MIQITKWLPDLPENRKWCERELSRLYRCLRKSGEIRESAYRYPCARYKDGVWNRPLIAVFVEGEK